jgi:adenylate cyclase
LRLSPFDLLVYLAYLSQGIAAVQEGNFEEGAAYAARAVQTNPNLSSLLFIEAATLALAGRLDKARVSAQRGFAMEPGFRLRLFQEVMAPEIAARLAEGGRLLGLPD